MWLCRKYCKIRSHSFATLQKCEMWYLHHIYNKLYLRHLIEKSSNCCVHGHCVFSLCSPITLFLVFLSQMICSTVQKASPQRFSASTCLPWRGTQRTSSEQNFAPCECQTQMPRGTNSELSSTRCVKVPFPCPFTQMRWKSSGEELQR